ncbi:MAG TPA: preprotein translocase subunit SecG [Luteimonas sp.]|nr:preprotein translocase subunit SecG [Luteimonas sp.]HRO27518.1 preprotein translocase subunit SecG [Luteimonas sp.]HRP72875.1 preprotein translocase subunit SecG [Luteimonas sp.]
MLLLTLNILFVLVAIAMIALILMQRGAGASAGSGFGGGASATVFGARGSANFLSKATKWLAIAFFAITLFMAWYATRQATAPTQGTDLGVMSQVPAAPVVLDVPVAPDATSTVPVAPAAQQSEAPATDVVPAVPAESPPPQAADEDR